MGKGERLQNFGLNHQSNAHNKTHHTLQKGSYAGHGCFNRSYSLVHRCAEESQNA